MHYQLSSNTNFGFFILLNKYMCESFETNTVCPHLFSILSINISKAYSMNTEWSTDDNADEYNDIGILSSK